MKKIGSSILLGAALVAFGAVPTVAQSYYSADGPAVRAGFGGALVVNGAEVLVGEPSNVMRPGMVYVYRRGADGQWGETASFGASDGDSGDGFGASLASEGDLLLVGGPGGVYSFSRSGDAWMEEGKLPTPGMLPEGSAFGATLALSGNVALVGASGRDNRTGAVFTYENRGGQLTAAGELPLAGVARNDRFGSSILLGDGQVGVGAVGANGGAGAAHAFQMTEEGWQPVMTVAAFDPSPRAAFGSAMAFVGDEVWISAPAANRGSGAVYAFKMSGDAVSGVDRVMAEALSGRVQAGRAIGAGNGFVAIAAPGADSGSGSVVFFDVASGTRTAEAVVQSEPEGFDAVRGEEVGCQDGEAGEWECGEVDLVSFVPVLELSGDNARGIRTNDNWGWEDPETGRLYALVGMTDRASFVDITDLTNPVVVGILPMTEGANGSAWRDIKTYMNHAYIVSDGAGQHGMQVFDLTRLRDFDGGEPTIFDEDALYTNVASTHNIVINEGSGFAYAVGAGGGGETCGGGLHMIDIRNPKEPTFAGCFADPQTGRASTGYSHDAQCVNYVGPDPDYQGAEICMGANETALSIADVTDKANPIAVSRASYPSVGYSHQGWLTDDHRYFYLNDELDELQDLADRTRTMIWDVSDLDDPQLIAEHMGTQESSDHNLYVVGNLMYQSNYQSGLRILDISQPEAPTEVAYFDTVPYGDNGAGFGGSWSNYPFFSNGIVIVTSGNEGLFLVRPTVRRTVF